LISSVLENNTAGQLSLLCSSFGSGPLNEFAHKQNSSAKSIRSAQL